MRRVGLGGEVLIPKVRLALLQIENEVVWWRKRGDDHVLGFQETVVLLAAAVSHGKAGGVMVVEIGTHCCAIAYRHSE